MKTSHSQTSVCRRCRYYEPEGRRGGHCQQLNVAVQGTWTACALAIPPFSPGWENFEDIMVWQQKTLAAMQASEQSDPLAAERCPVSQGANGSLEDDRAVAESSFQFTPCGITSPVAEPMPTKGLKALWM
ncbi:MAG: hypothetical protein ACAF41_19870 [Leptolyngbya sp. BL-A-14]